MSRGYASPMTIERLGLLGAVFGTLLAASGCLSPVKSSPQGDTAQAAVDRLLLAKETITQWSNFSALAARRVIEKYGVPNEVRYNRLVWNRNGPWRRTVVRDVRPAYEVGEEVGVIEQTIDYSLSPTQAVRVAAFDDRVTFNPRVRELSARSDQEERNFLRLNLAHDVASGSLRPAQARDMYARTLSFEEAGKSSPYLSGLMFVPQP